MRPKTADDHEGSEAAVGAGVPRTTREGMMRVLTIVGLTPRTAHWQPGSGFRLRSYRIRLMIYAAVSRRKRGPVIRGNDGRSRGAYSRDLLACRDRIAGRRALRL